MSFHENMVRAYMMRSTWGWTRLQRALASVTAAVALGACGAEGDAAEDGALAQEFVRVVNVEVVPLQRERFVEEIRLTSVAMANQDVMVAAEESGVIREVFVEHGQAVDEGQPIAKIDDRLLTAQVTQARAGAEMAAQTWERRRRLWEEDRVGSEIAYLEARLQSEQAAAALTVLEERLARTVIRAPFGGVVDERRVDVGAMVNPGTSVAHLVDLDPIKIVAGVPERYAADIHTGDMAVVEFEGFDGGPREARIRYVGATVDPGNRTFPVEVRLPNPRRLMKPQMVANMAVTRQTVDDAIVVPQDALVRVENGYVAFVAVDRGGEMVAEAREVVLGPARRNLVVIAKGLAEGERLIVVGQKSVEHGDRIRVVAEGT